MSTIRSVSIESKSGLVQVSSNVWILETTEQLYSSPITQSHTHYSTTLIRLKSGNLVAICPTQLNSDLKTHLAKLGPVEYLILPHQTYSESTDRSIDKSTDKSTESWCQTYPNVKIFTLLELAHKQITEQVESGLPENPHADKSKLEWTKEIQSVFNTNSESSTEALFLYRSSRTAIWVNSSAPSQHKTRSDSSSQRMLQAILRWDLEYLIVAHRNLKHPNSEQLLVSYIEGSEEISAFLQHALKANSPKPSKISRITNYSKEAIQLTVSLLLVAPIYLLVVLVTDIVYPQIIRLIGTSTRHPTSSKNNVSLEKAK